jgi:hypothetical protein
MAGSPVRSRAITIASAVAVAALALGASTSQAGSPISKSAGPPWADPAHQGELELVAGRIASSLAGRPAVVRCESPSSWQALADQFGFDANPELGYIPVAYDATAQTVLTDSTQIELSPQVCLALQQFASADPKPTTCTIVITKYKTVLVKRRVLVRERTTTGGRVRIRAVWRVEDVPTRVAQQTRSTPQPCFARGAPVSGMSNAYWSRYADAASALLVLAHETVHLGQYRAGSPVPGTDAAESEAQCVGMQWMASVAVQLGDTPADAEAIAQFTYENLYPNFKGTPYWSADCVSGGALDRRGAGHRAWP